MLPIRALNRERVILSSIKITLGGEEFPFRLYGYSDRRPDRELSGILVDQDYRDAGWQVYWGPFYESETEGHIRTFKLAVVTAEELIKEG